MTRDNDFRRLMEEFRPHVSHRHADGLADLDLLTYALLVRLPFGLSLPSVSGQGADPIGLNNSTSAPFTVQSRVVTTLQTQSST